MEAILALFLGCMVLLGNVTAEDCQTDNRMESVQHCIAQCPFSTLEGATKEEKNQLNLWTTFHHPRKSFPQYLVVRYSANVTSDDVYYNTTETYLWTSNSIYFVIPPQVFSFLSLFIGALDDAHTGETNFTIPEECRCWMNGSLYFTDEKCSVMNYLEILTEKLRDIANVSGTPESASNYLYQSKAVRKENLPDVYHKYSNTFYSFIIVLPFLATITYAIIIFSQNKDIKENKMKQKRQNFAALIGLGLTLGLYIILLDIFALSQFTDKDHTTREIYFSKENAKNNQLYGILIAHTVMELIIYSLGEMCVWILIICQCMNKCENCNALFLLIPPIWCLVSHFGFVAIAWSSFARRSKSLTLFYIFGTTVMFLVMRQIYALICKQEDGIVIWIIQVVRLVGALLGGIFAYLMFGLWQLPVSETVEESPVYLYDSLQLIVIVLAVLVSYRISFQDNEIEILKEISEKLDQNIAVEQ